MSTFVPELNTEYILYRKMVQTDYPVSSFTQ